MEIFKRKIETNAYSAFFLGDIHEGSKLQDEKSLKKSVQYILSVSKERSVDVFLMGDLIECITPDDKRFSPSEISSNYKIEDLKDLPNKQADRIIKVLSPIKHLIKVALIGNHCEKYVSKKYNNVYNYYCNKLECKKLGFLAVGRITVSYKKKSHSIDICLTHGTIASQNDSSAISGLVNSLSKYDCDVYLAGHGHKLFVYVQEKMKLNRVFKKSSKIRFYGMTGCFLETVKVGCKGYWEGKKGDFSAIGFIELKADLTDKWRHKLLTHRFIDGDIMT